MTYIYTNNPKYKNLVVDKSILRAFSATKEIDIRLIDCSKGRLRGRYFVVDKIVDGELFQILEDFQEVISKIKTISIRGEIIAKRKFNDAQLLTTGYGWRSYYLYLPDKYR